MPATGNHMPHQLALRQNKVHIAIFETERARANAAEAQQDSERSSAASQIGDLVSLATSK